MALSTFQLIQIVLSAGSVVLAAALFWATYHYTQETTKQTEEMEATRRADVKPYLKAGVDYFGPVAIEFVIENTGNGAAHDVQTEWYVEDIPEGKRTWNIPLISPGERYTFWPPVFEDEDEITVSIDEIESQLEDSEGQLKFTAECDDILGYHHTFSETIDMHKAIWGRSEGREILRDSTEDKIQKGIENIAKNVNAVSKELDMEGVSDVARHEVNEATLEVLREEGEIKADTLSKLTGIPFGSTTDAVHRLSEAGIVEYDGEWVELNNYQDSVVVRLKEKNDRNIGESK